MNLDAPVNGDMKCLPNGRQCDFSCNDGYEMIGFYRKVCLGKQKGWKPIKPVLCKSSAEVENEIQQVMHLMVFLGGSTRYLISDCG